MKQIVLNNYEELLKDPVVMHYETEGDRWIEHLNASARELNANINGHGMHLEPPNESLPGWHYHITLSPNEGSTLDLPHLIVVPTTNPEEVYIYIASDDSIDDTQRTFWKNATENALARLRAQSNTVLKWEAVIGQISQPGLYEHHSLKSKSKIGNLTIKPTRSSYVSLSTNSQPAFDFRGFELTFPIIVEGEATGFDWHEASEKASKDINRLVALVSLAWASTWQIIHAPVIKEGAGLRVPKTGIGIDPRFAIPFIRHRKTIPKWVDSAFTKLDTNDSLSDSLITYHESLLMEELHPSFALLAFVASIESIGKMLSTRKTGNKARFLIALRTAFRTEKKFKKLRLCISHGVVRLTKQNSTVTNIYSATQVCRQCSEKTHRTTLLSVMLRASSELQEGY